MRKKDCEAVIGFVYMMTRYTGHGGTKRLCQLMECARIIKQIDARTGRYSMTQTVRDKRLKALATLSDIAKEMNGVAQMADGKITIHFPRTNATVRVPVVD